MNLNEPKEIRKRDEKGLISHAWPKIILFMRALIIFSVGLLIALIFYLSGQNDVWQKVIIWWPIQAIIANLAILFILNRLLKKGRA